MSLTDSLNAEEGQKAAGSRKGIFRIVPPPIVAMIIVLILAGVVIAGFAWAQKTVTLVVDGRETVVKTTSSTVGKLLKEKGIVPGPKDKVDPPVSEQLKEGSRVELMESHHVTVEAGGEITEFDTTAATVGDALKEKNIALNQGDLVAPESGYRIAGDVKIKVTRVRVAEEVKNVPIPYSVRRDSNPEMARGITRVIKKGSNGVEQQRWRVTYHDSQAVEHRLVDKKTVTEPVPGIIQVGSGQSVSRGGRDIRFSRAMEIVATAYTYTGRNTASGRAPGYGLVAVDTSVIPFGTKLYIDGYGYAVAADRGRAIKGNRVDVFLESERDARRWGVRRVNMYILQ
ncbi:cell wall-binding protein [Desulfocucumis palustris]|uniref:Cell wall-binding protein n=1 Tax=Desulfocucumis palustris TaxID=1898651 RepID=A0A2L2XDD2_9FIRM|nr:3D domain-containing protein [Desulfocucumis palustris]GBF34359.1 cell wall-binding protein [Desulfocucumis palustris]